MSIFSAIAIATGVALGIDLAECPGQSLSKASRVSHRKQDTEYAAGNTRFD
ncbi:hypothetical protein [uncultured Ruegeria sp.]|uniref:hypothetical protein n=1 Tax=uncultured Ruegeria sp. TaxID=259304 RepID=UPI00261E2924|nr:hypothetical protein [uncultured Ruegeria sp.]